MADPSGHEQMQAELGSERTARRRAEEELVDTRREAEDNADLASGLSKRVGKLQDQLGRAEDERDELERFHRSEGKR